MPAPSSTYALRPALAPAEPDRSPRAPEVHVFVPAHNEEASVGATLLSLAHQTLPPTVVTVVADGCTDHTVGAALIEGAAIYVTRDNQAKKAGALNQVLRLRLPSLHPDDLVLVMDADSVISPDFLEVAVRRLRDDPELGAVGGVFVGDRPRGWLEQAQANEYTRYSRDIARKNGRVMVLTGTASVLRVRALREVAAARGAALPGINGDVYDTAALTEDNEITLALKHLGWTLVSPRECVVQTELMPTLGDLHQQRLRWYRGAVENLRTYGWTPVTARYWLQQTALLACVAMFGLFLSVTVADLLLGILHWSPWWTLVAGAFLVERVVTVWRTRSRRSRLLAAAVLPEMAYDLFLQVTFLRAAANLLRAQPAQWQHATRQPR